MGEPQRRGRRPDESLRKDQRIARSSDFRVVMSQGTRGVGKHLVAFWSAPRDPGTASRVGVVASRKIGGAVLRSRAKRLLREVYRRTPGRPAGDVVLIARSGICTAPWDGLVRAYQQAIRKATRTSRPVLRQNKGGTATPRSGMGAG